MKDAVKRNCKGPRYRYTQFNTLSRSVVRNLAKTPGCTIKDTAVIRNIIEDLNRMITDTIIDYRDGVELPEQLGYMFLGTCPTKIKPNVDFKKTDHYLKVIQHRNWESDDYLAKIFYTTYETKYNFKFHEVWGFKGCRNFTSKVGKEYPKDWKKYIQVDHTLKISRLYRSSIINDFKKEKEKERLINYNPLDI